MTGLSRYLLKLFSIEAMSLFAVAGVLLFLIQCLRLFDVVSDKGQSLLTLLGQASLGMPALGIAFLYVCLGIGLGRALRNLQGSSELQIIHVSSLVPALLRAIGLYTAAGTLTVLLLAHIVDPLSVRATNDWSASIAADLVSRSMIPHRFTELVTGVTIIIGARDAEGNIDDFFADDRRDLQSRRSYFAKTAVIHKDEKGYVLTMHDGAVQYMSDDKRFSQISFASYDLALDQLAGTTVDSDDVAQKSSLDLIAAGLLQNDWNSVAVHSLLKRSGEGLRIIAMCAFVAAFAIFPTGRRRRFDLPIEFIVLGGAFFERAVTSYVSGPGIFGVASGSILLLGFALIVLMVRLRVFRPARFKRLPG